MTQITEILACLKRIEALLIPKLQLVSQPCANPECTNSFLVQPRKGRTTTILRRRFCSDRCRIANNRLELRQALARDHP